MSLGLEVSNYKPEFSITCHKCDLTNHLPPGHYTRTEAMLLDCPRCGTPYTTHKDGMKHDQDKLRFDLLPTHPIREVVKVLMHGAEKYDDFNWKLVDNLRARYYSAACRHLLDWWDGIAIDDESGLHPLAHVICNLIFLMEDERMSEDEKATKWRNNE